MGLGLAGLINPQQVTTGQITPAYGPGKLPSSSLWSSPFLNGGGQAPGGNMGPSASRIGGIPMQGAASTALPAAVQAWVNGNAGSGGNGGQQRGGNNIYGGMDSGSNAGWNTTNAGLDNAKALVSALPASWQDAAAKFLGLQNNDQTLAGLGQYSQPANAPALGYSATGGIDPATAAQARVAANQGYGQTSQTMSGGEGTGSGWSSGSGGGGGGDSGGGGGFASNGRSGDINGGPITPEKVVAPRNDGHPDNAYISAHTGEYVINQNAVQKYGPALLRSINNGTFKKG